jgi:uncharacterized protein (DUF2267 family)
MDELVALVQEKTGLGEEQARQAVETVIGYLKQKLPTPLAKQVDAALANEDLMDQAGDVLDRGAAQLGGLLSRKKK